MQRTVLITGTSSGIGKATALYCAQQGWQVAATMRSPDKHNDFAAYNNIKTYHLDVTEPQSVAEAITNAVNDFGQIDVVVNNAGFSVFGAFEWSTEQEIQQQLNTNLLGVMNVTRAILPHFRQRRRGKLIAVTSVGGLAAFPLFTLYHASKWAVEGFMESLHYELRQFNIQIKLVEPGAVASNFTENTHVSQNGGLTAYDAYVENVRKNFSATGGRGYSQPLDVAKTILRAAQDDSTRMRYPVGNAALLLRLRRWLPLAWFQRLVRQSAEAG